jgi:putative hydrolase of the HAD superfamily
VAQRRRNRFLELSAELAVLPGVVRLLDEARAAGVPCAIASSSESHWVNGYLKRFAIKDRFLHVVTRDLVPRPKPYPDLYREACLRLGVEPERSVALEDSVNGVKAAIAAGLVCIAVPNSVTARFDLSCAHLQSTSMEQLDLTLVEQVLNQAREQARS